jgi:DNA-binding transcriptional regulator YhcF (GntR family)
MDIVLNRSGGVAVRDQIMAQLELKILAGEFTHGQRLPSVRSLARRLKVHHNTVSAAYQDLEAAGHVELKKGAGVFVRRARPSALGDARGLDEMIRMALHAAFHKGYTGPEIRAAVERWLAAAPPDRILVVDPSREMGELLVHEIGEGLSVAASAISLEELSRDPAAAAGALALSLPYHVDSIRALAPGAALEEVTLEVSQEHRKAILALPAGSIVLVVSHSPTVLPFASVYIRSLRGDEVHVEARLLGASREWKRLVSAADLVFADSLSAEAVRRTGHRRVREVRVVAPSSLERLKGALRVVTPRGKGRP